MTAALWSSSAHGVSAFRSRVLARAPQIVTFILGLAIAAQLALIVVILGARGRQNAPPPVAMTLTVPSTSRATRRRSPSRKSRSP